METHELIPHPAHPAAHVSSIAARVTGLDANWLRLRWRIEGSAALVVPDFGGRGRADELWRTTCFELFVRPSGGEAYCEYNLSPSERWAAYDFSSYRDGMRERAVSPEPACTMRLGSTFAIFDAAIPAASLPGGISAIGLSAVIEEDAGVKSYWALTHPRAVPDFHDPACFTAQLTAPPAP